MGRERERPEKEEDWLDLRVWALADEADIFLFATPAAMVLWTQR